MKIILQDHRLILYAEAINMLNIIMVCSFTHSKCIAKYVKLPYNNHTRVIQMNIHVFRVLILDMSYATR